MDANQERRLAHGLKAGRSEAWREFYDAFAERVWRSVARLLGSSAADVADVVQETFIAAASAARSYDPERGRLWVWLWSIARRHLALHFRKQSRQQRLALAVRWARDNGALGADPQQERELTEHVRAILAGLPAEYADVLIAFYLDETAVRELADEEGVSESAIRSRLARARTAFREACERRAAAPAPRITGESP